MRWFSALLTTLSLAPAAAVPAISPCGPWQQVLPWPTDATLRGVAYGDGRFVAVGEGVALVSEDGVVWTVAAAWADLDLNAVTWAGDRFVAVGSSPYASWRQGQVAWSRDGAEWRVVPVMAYELEDVAWDGHAFVAVGWHADPGVGADLLRSEDGETWTALAVPAAGVPRAVASGGGVWVTAGEGLLRSPDGWTWQQVDDRSFQDVAWDGRRFVAVGFGGVFASPDGAAWSELGGPRWGGCVAASGGSLLTAGGWPEFHGRTYPGEVATSADGLLWSEASASPRVVLDATWAEGLWVAVGWHGLLGTSSDGFAWRWHGQQARERAFYDAAGSSGTTVAVGGQTGPYTYLQDLLWSAAGVGWEASSITGATLLDASWVGDRWLAVGSIGSVSSSVDGRSWTALPVFDIGLTWRGSAGTPAAVVVVGERYAATGAVAVSRDGEPPAEVPLPPTGPLGDVLWTGSRVVAVGAGVVGRSADGLEWHFDPVGETLLRLATDGSRVVAVGGSGAAAWSDDGETWTAAATGATVELTELAWAGDRFVAGSPGGTLLESPDGEDWTTAEPFPWPDLEGLAWDGRELVGVSRSPVVARRRCGEGNLLPESAARLLVPAVAHRPGAGGTSWRSDLHVVSTADGWAEVWLGLVPAGMGEPTWQRFLLPPGGQLDRDDLVARTFGLDAAAGQLLVASEQPLAVSSRTFTGDGVGSWGQEVPAVPGADLAAGATSVVVPMLRHDATSRSNLGLVNAGETPLTLEVELLDAAGASLGVFSRDLGPLGWLQEDGVLATLGAAPVADAYAVVSSDDPAARFAAYGSVVDSSTGDPTLVLGLAASSEPLLVPAVAHGAGAAGTFWTSDLAVANPGPAPASYRLELLVGEVQTSVVLELGPGESRRHADLVASVFAATGTAALRVVPTAGAVAVASRTSTPGGRGSYGQGVPAVAEEATGGGRLVLPGLAESGSFRTNLGLVNPGDEDLAATVALYRGDGSLVGTLERVVPASSLVVLTRAFAVAGDAEVASGYAVVTTATPGARLLAWSSVVDSSTGDPVLALDLRLAGVVASPPSGGGDGTSVSAGPSCGTVG